jgi:pimeloyl-ACP methyl ester carboxylesterase
MPYANNQGIRIHYEVEGTGAPLILQHGFTDSLETWYEHGYVGTLKRDYRLILVDARGHGASDKPHDNSLYAMERRTADILSVLRDLDVGRAHYFGYSMGGWIGFGMARHASDRLTSLIVGGSDAASRTREPHPLLTPEMERRGAAAIVDLWDAPMSPALRKRVQKNDMEAIRASRVDDPGYEDILPTIAVPCLLLAGDKDPIYPTAQAHALTIPSARFVTIAGLNHAETFFRGDLMVPHIKQFLSGVA